MSQPARGNPPRRGRTTQNRAQANAPAPRAPPPNPPQPAAPAPAQNRATSREVRRNNAAGQKTTSMFSKRDSSEAALTAQLEEFAATFSTAGQDRILPTPTPNYANSMSFQKVISVAGQTGPFSGVKSRMFELDPFQPWEKGIQMTEEGPMTSIVSNATGELNNSKDFEIHSTMSFPMSVTGTNNDGQSVSIETIKVENVAEDVYAWNPDGTVTKNAYWHFPAIEFSGLNAVSEEHRRAVVNISDQATPATPLGIAQYYNTQSNTWTPIPGSTNAFAKSGSQNVWTINFGSNDGNKVVGNVRILITLQNASTLGNVRSASVTTYLADVTSANTVTYNFPLCAQADVEEVRSVWNSSSHVRLGALAFWMQPTAAGLSNGGSVLAAQVLKTTYYPKAPTLAFEALSELPDRRYVGPFKTGAYGWYNADRVRDLEFKPQQGYYDDGLICSKLVVIVRPENFNDSGQSYLFKVNSMFNYRWQSRVFRPTMTPCSFELLARLLTVNAAYCNVGCNPSHVDKIRALARDFAMNPENRRIAKDALRLMLPGLKGMADATASSFIPGYNILKGAIKPYI